MIRSPNPSNQQAKSEQVQDLIDEARRDRIKLSNLLAHDSFSTIALELTDQKRSVLRGMMRDYSRAGESGSDIGERASGLKGIMSWNALKKEVSS